MKKDVFIAIFLPLIWCAIIAFSSATPIGGNKLGDTGMWSSMAFMLILFLSPLPFHRYKVGKLAEAAIVGLFLAGAVCLSIFSGVMLIQGYSYMLSVCVFSVLYIILSVFWYAIAFQKS